MCDRGEAGRTATARRDGPQIKPDAATCSPNLATSTPSFDWIATSRPTCCTGDSVAMCLGRGHEAVTNYLPKKACDT